MANLYLSPFRGCRNCRVTLLNQAKFIDQILNIVFHCHVQILSTDDTDNYIACIIVIILIIYIACRTPPSHWQSDWRVGKSHVSLIFWFLVRVSVFLPDLVCLNIPSLACLICLLGLPLYLCEFRDTSALVPRVLACFI